ncbi:hypothetical protein Vi05172_g2261 [Venturia inaequalis]|nr:hypothetical protein Vi05172_g2261 [Venturia inaequalis]
MAAAKTQLTAQALKAADPADDAKSDKSVKTTTSSLKRKRGNDLKFYAVKAGKVPEIYHSWADCIDQVKGFPGAIYKSFTSLTEAEAFMKTGNSPPSNATPKKFYAVQSGHIPGVYTEWPEAQKQITGWKGPRHRKFTTRAEAEAFVAAGINDGTPSIASAARETDSSGPVAKKSKTTKSKAAVVDLGEIPLGWAPLLADAEDGFDRRLIMDPETGELRMKTEQEFDAKKPVSKVEDFAKVLEIWTDGACRGNGKNGAVAGVGVYFGDQDPRNMAEPLSGTRQTNQRAELTAIKRALNCSPLNRHVLIHSDSNYSIKCVTDWFPKWEKNNWKNSANKDVENKDLIQEILALIRDREISGVKTNFHWVKGHGTDYGNNEADKLAVAGAEEARRIRDSGGVIPDVTETKQEVDM